MRRVLIYAHYDAGGLVDSHVFYKLQSFKDEGVDIIFATNSSISKEARRRLQEIVERIVVRKNRGFDFGAWRGVLLSEPREKWEQYNEVLLGNSSCYGPLFPLSELFGKMGSEDCDFWGITKHLDTGEYKEHIYPKSPQRLQAL